MSCPCCCTPTTKALGDCILDVAGRSGLTVYTDPARREAMLRLGLGEVDATAEAAFVEVAGKTLWLLQDKREFLQAIRRGKFVVRDGKGDHAP